MPNRWRIFSRWLRLRRRLWRWRRAATKRPLQAEAPLRSQLFNAEQMELHGRGLARSHRVHSRPGPDRLLDRLEENEGLLDDASTLLTRMVQHEMRITPAGEWLLDNYYLVEEQIHTARRHLPKGYSRQLPSLIQGPSAGLPRVYDLIAVVRMLRTTLASTCPVRTDDGAIAKVRKRSMIPSFMSLETLTAVVDAPKPAHSRMIPGTT